MKIGFVGLGIMGDPMCRNIISKSGDAVYVYDTDADKVKSLAAFGANACSDALKVAKKSDLIITMVPKSEHSLSVWEQMLPAMDKNKIGVDMSTIDPSVSVEIAEKVKKKGGRFADAPVVKSRPAAIAGSLGIYVGCDEELFDVIRPVLAYMGANIIRMGGNGMGLVMKICHNSLVAEIQNGVNETLLLASKYGISPDVFRVAASYGGAQNFYLDGQAEKIMNRDWTTAFSIDNMRKDLGIALGMAAENGLDLPGLANARRVYDDSADAGEGGEDFRATYKAVEREAFAE